MKPGSRFIEKQETVPDIRIIITKIKGTLTVSQIDAFGQLQDFRPCAYEKSILGNIYVGKVEKVIKSLSACFVDIGICHCFLPFEEYFGENEVPKQGERVLVQIKRDAVKTKEPSCSCYITLTGRYIVVSEKKKGDTSISITKKLTDKVQRESLRTAFSGYADHYTTDTEFNLYYDIILRTNGIIDHTKTKAEFDSLFQKIHDLRSVARHRNDFSILYEEHKSYIRYVRDFSLSEDFSAMEDKSSYFGRIESTQTLPTVEIVTDQEKIYQELSECIPNWNDLYTLRFYEDTALSLCSLYRIEHFANELLSKKVWLKSGGYLVIEQTEALNVIDVNSGKVQPKKGAKDTIYRLNEEAATEAARQIRLRNLSGMILIDFINDEKEGTEKLISFLSALLKKDRIHCRFVDVTKLGLYEITRQRVEPSLKELLEFQE